MDEFGQLPLGDLRQALVALSRKGALWRDIFAFRFPPGLVRNGDAHAGPGFRGDGAAANAEPAGVSGHSLGNLILAALQTINEGNLLHAIMDAQELLDAAGTVLPVTLSHTTLCAELADGHVVCGETNIDTRGRRDVGPLLPISRVFLQEDPHACIDTMRAIRRADVIVIGPGDLYTSILPNLLVRGIAEAVRSSEAHRVYVCNLMTKRGETDGFRASDFVQQVLSYLGHGLDRVILHDGSVPEQLREQYASEHQNPVEADIDAVRQLVPDVVVDDLVTVRGDHLIRHDADRLIRAIFSPPPYGLLDADQIQQARVPEEPNGRMTH
jgi:uncharacterized cofD-like protein